MQESLEKDLIASSNKKVVVNRYYATGRRKTSVARVYVTLGNGKITVNKKNIDEYFPLMSLQYTVNQPLQLLDSIGKYNIKVSVHGGGLSGQAAAIRHGIARAMLQIKDDSRVTLKRAGFLRRDPRMKERKKYGLKGARKAPQFSKR
jgi:small subunit ribosomal protein S9